MDKKEETDEFDKALEGFDEEPLNLTNQEKKDDPEDPETMNKVKQEYEKFMKEMQGGFQSFGINEGEPSLQGIGNALGNLMKGLTQEMGEGGEDDLGKKFGDMFKNLNEDNMQEAAANLLNEFMDKSLLEEPLKQTKANYEQYFQKNEGQISEADLARYKGQYKIVLEILEVLNESPENKSKMISLFEKMQELGQPPEGIAPATGLV